MSRKVVVTAGYSNSIHALSVAELSMRKGVDIVSVLVVSEFQVSRIRKYVAAKGIGVIWKMLTRYHHKRLASSNSQTDRIQEFVSANSIALTSLEKWCRTNSVPFHRVQSLNSNSTLALLDVLEYDLVAYCGGGILGPAFISRSKGMVINAHSGKLPYVRGMNGVEWTILLGLQPTVTMHFIDSGIDTGEVIQEIPISVNRGLTIEEIRDECTIAGINGMVSCILNLTYPSRIVNNSEVQYRQCYVLAPALRELLESKIDRMATIAGNID